MLGAPRTIVGDLNELFGVIGDTLDDVLGPLNPLAAPIAEIKQFAKDKIQEAIEEELHIDIDQLKSFVTLTHALDRDQFAGARAPRAWARNRSTCSSPPPTPSSTR